MKTWSWLAMLFVVLLSGAGFVHVGTEGPSVERPSFLRHLAPGGAPFTGVVVEEIPAGGYVYRHIRTDADELDWVVDLGRVGLVGQQVKVRPFGLATDFHSARTGRVFDRLYFAMVRPQEKT